MNITAYSERIIHLKFYKSAHLKNISKNTQVHLMDITSYSEEIIQLRFVYLQLTFC